MSYNELSEQEQLRRRSLAALRELGIEPYPAAMYDVTATAAQIADGLTADNAADYADVGALKALADRLGVCLVVIHHLRKTSDDTDPFNRIAGSNGIFGAADAALVLTRSKREDSQTVLDLTGRDVEDNRLVLRFDKARCLWRSLGTPAEAERAALADGYDQDPLVQTVLAQLDERGGKWQTNAKGLMAACEALAGCCPVSSGQALAKELDKLAPLLAERSSVRCRILSSTHSGRQYAFDRASQPAAV